MQKKFSEMFELIITKCESFKVDILYKIKSLSADTIGWIAILCLHSVTIPSMIALMLGVTDNVPPVDMVIILWAALGLFFLKSIIKRDILNLITIGLGFMGHAMLMALIFFK